MSETAFFQSRSQGKEFRLRWFTPLTEVPLCGHATLATAHVIFSHLKSEADEIYFHTLSGVISAKKADKDIRLDFPRNDPAEVETPREIMKALGLRSWRDVSGSAVTVIEGHLNLPA